ncbi:hypothetical protein, partial [Clostridium botulinum]|uniref:hypothetical protein n=1 Tax=Clostridium botulinum TaxID=1491 RepID=UPI000B2A8E74
NMQLKGRTLQNLWNNENVVSLKNDAMLIQTISTDDFRTNMLKDNIEYSIVNLSNKKTRADITTKNSNAYVKTLYIEPHSIQKFTISSQYISSFYGLISEGWTNTDSDKDIFKKACMILEGDYTNKEIPQYFEGIKSVGESEGNKISILTCGKNMVDVMKLKDSPTVKIKSIDKNVVILEQIVDNRKYVQIPIYLTFKPNTKYVLSGNLLSANTCLKIYDLENNIQYSILEKTGSVMFTTREKSNLQLLFYTSNTENENIGKIASFENVMIEEGTTATSYEQYKADKTEILLPNEPLRGIGDIRDIVDFDKGEITRNVGKIILNGSNDENWVKRGKITEKTICFGLAGSQIPNNNIFISKFCISNRFRLDSPDNTFNLDTPSFCFNDYLTTRMDKSLLETQDINGFKKLLKSWADAGTPLEVYYQLAEPKTEKLTIKDTLQSFENGYIQLDNAITPTAQLEY